MPGGAGLGTFDSNQTASLKDRPNNTKLAFLTNGNSPDKMGAVVRYVSVILLPRSNDTLIHQVSTMGNQYSLQEATRS